MRSLVDSLGDPHRHEGQIVSEEQLTLEAEGWYFLCNVDPEGDRYKFDVSLYIGNPRFVYRTTKAYDLQGDVIQNELGFYVAFRD